MSKTEKLLKLADALGAFDGVTHWAISMRVLKKGDFFDRLKRGKGCRAATFRRVLQKFHEIWPLELAWPADIPRPPIAPPDSSNDLKEAS